MDFATILQAVSTIGFPIVMCLLLLYYIQQVTEAHKEETEKFTIALNQNTLAVQRLCDIMNVEREEE